MKRSEDSSEGTPRKWSEGARFGAGLLGFITWVFLYGAVGFDLARWQLEMFGTPESQTTLAATWLVTGFAPVFVAVVILFVRGGLHDAA